MTKKKLELTRLPHELLIPAASVGERERGGGVREGVFGTEKKEIEPLIDFWYVLIWLSLRLLYVFSLLYLSFSSSIWGWNLCLYMRIFWVNTWAKTDIKTGSSNTPGAHENPI